MASLYRPHIQQGIQMFDQMVNRHSEDLATAELKWREWKLKDDDGVVYAVQLLPWVKAVFKGPVSY